MGILKSIGANLLRGAAIGIANLIPGVSGGTIAIILDIYEQLIEAIASLLRFDSDWWRRFLFLLQIGGGALVALLLFARLIDLLLEQQPIAAGLFFVGLVLGSVPHLWRRLQATKPTIITIVPFLCGLIIAPLLTAIPLLTSTSGTATSSGPGLLFLSGIAGAAAMALPGISGSFVLLLIGTYRTIIDALSSLDLLVLAIVAVGVLIGLGSISVIIRRLLQRWPGPILAALFGLVLGSIVRIWPGLPSGWDNVTIGAGALIVGLLPALLLGRLRPRS